jgi:hypothetical protein
MSIDLTTEEAVPLSDVPKLPWLRGRGGKRLHVATVHRWCTHGINRVRLEFVQRGGTRVTTQAALIRFFDRLTLARGVASPDRTARDQDRADHVERALDDAGIG